MDNTPEQTKLLNGVTFKPEGGVIAGGAITSVFTGAPINDYDLYFPTKESILNAVQDAYDEGLWCVHASKRSLTFRGPVSKGESKIYQIITYRAFPTPDDIFASFDFTCCMGAYELSANRFVFSPRFLPDVAARRLVFNHGTDFPIASGLRVLKYMQKGYSILRQDLLKLLVSVNFRSVSNWGELADQLGGHYGDDIRLNSAEDYTLNNAITAINSSLIGTTPQSLEVPYSFLEAKNFIETGTLEHLTDGPHAI